MKCRRLTQLGRDGFVLGFELGSEPIEGLRQATGTELQAEAIAQNDAGFAHGKAFGLVEIGSHSEGSWTEVHTGRADCQ